MSVESVRPDCEQTAFGPSYRLLGAKVLFVTMDLAYGTPRTLEKLRVLELVARMPYRAWENVGYVAVMHTARRPQLVRRGLLERENAA